MKHRRLLRRVMIGASAIAFAAAPAAAQRVDRIVAFGDSYADDGNAFQIAGVDPAITVIYPTGRFSGGTNYVDTLGDILGVPTFNYAIGGARTDNGNQTVGLPGFTFEVQSFLNATGGVNGAFPTIEGTFDENDLVTVSIGGNDSRAYQQGGGDLDGAAEAAAGAAAAATANLNLLVSAGAPTISFLAGDTGRLPEIATDPIGAAIRSAFSGAFNSAMQATLSGYAADGVMVHYLDLNLVLDNVIADPTAFGITNGLVCPIFPDPTCILNSSGYLFYGDALHLTSDGFAIVGRYVATQLQAPLTLGAPSDLGLDTARQFGRTLTSRLDLSGPRDGDVAEGVNLFVVGDMLQRDVEADSASDGFDIDSVGATAGATFGFNNGIAGLAVNYSRPKARFGNGASDDRARSWQVGGFAGMTFGGAFAQGYAGAGWDRHDIDRTGVVEDMNSSPDGKHWLAGAKAGYLMPLGTLRIGPVVALDYAKAKVEGYTESGDPALTLDVDSVSAKALVGSLGLELRGDLDDSGVKLRPFASAAIEKDLIGDGRVVRFAQTASPTIVNSWRLEDRDTGAYGRLAAGASAQIVSSVGVDAIVSGTVGRNDGNDVSAQLGVNVGF